jgi:hypothetical protein
LKERYVVVSLEANKKMVYGGKDITMNHVSRLVNQTLLIIIKMKRLAWAGHVAHMNSDRILKKIFNTKPEGVKSVGRPKLRWDDGVNKDMKTLGVKNWKNATPERDEWTQLLKKARAQQGLSSR